MYYRIRILRTSKRISSKQEDYQTFDDETKDFETLEQVKSFLQENYGKVKKVKMYVETKDRNGEHIGWIYCFVNSDVSHNTKRWYQQDWVEVSEVTEKRIVV